MISIDLENAGKRYLQKWIFRSVTSTLCSDHSYLISGFNGSGKSTLLKVISGFISPDEGAVAWKINGENIPVDLWAGKLAICAPYLEVIEEFRLDELLDFHQKVKPLYKAFSAQEFAQVVELDYQSHKAIKYYSSGMKQRVKLGLALLSGCPVILLDEPISNLDAAGVNWYKKIIAEINTPENIIVVCSNDTAQEAYFCEKEISIEDYLPQPRKI